MRTVTTLALALTLGACSGPYYLGKMPVDPADELFAGRPEVTPEPTAPVASPLPGLPNPEDPADPAPLIGWDGKEVTPDDRPLHELETDAGSRNYLIDLYVKSKERVDELEVEVMDLHDLLGAQEGVISERDALLLAERDKVTDLEGQLAAERARTADLEARLITAQIRRLEAERQLLVNLLETQDEPLPTETALAGGQQ